MPYINSYDRERIDEKLDELIEGKFLGISHIAYILWRLLRHYKNDMGENYHTHTTILGMLDSIKQEWYRRETAPYEEEKREQNGDC